MENETKKTLAELNLGDCFRIGTQEFVVLEHCIDATAVITKDVLADLMEFGENNNYDGSYVDAACIAFADRLADIIGRENLVEHEVDLTSDDGLKDYGSVQRFASLLTCDRYRKYVEVLDEHKPRRWWWLATAFSTKKHDSDWWVKCVAPSGYIFIGLCSIDGLGVRPFCILKSSIFVSV